MKNESNVDKWLAKETPQKAKALENASRYFSSDDSLTVNILKSIYGRESSYGSLRRKRGIKGAVGDFQLEQQTARRLGLSVTKQNDQRFDIDKSSSKILKSLEKNPSHKIHKKLKSIRKANIGLPKMADTF